MNNLQHIRSLAEMILKQVNELETVNTVKPAPAPKFKVGDKVVWLSDCREEPMTVTSVGIDTFNTGNPTVVFPNESGIYYEYWALSEDGKVSSVFGEAALKLYVAPNPEPKFKVGDSVYFSYGNTNGVGVVVKHEIRRCIDHDINNYLLHYSQDNGIANQWFGEVFLSHAQPKVEDREWHSGPPPHIGWWNASVQGGVDRHKVWRWWNGKSWSLAVGDQESAAMAGVRATQRYYKPNGEIEWTDYWPENARVPRVDPGVEE